MGITRYTRAWLTLLGLSMLNAFALLCSFVLSVPAMADTYILNVPDNQPSVSPDSQGVDCGGAVAGGGLGRCGELVIVDLSGFPAEAKYAKVSCETTWALRKGVGRHFRSYANQFTVQLASGAGFHDISVRDDVSSPSNPTYEVQSSTRCTATAYR